MRHGSEVHPKVTNRERTLAQVDDRDVAESTTLPLERRGVLASPSDVKYQLRVQRLALRERSVACLGRHPDGALREREPDAPVARGRVEVDPTGDILPEVVRHRGVERGEGEALPGCSLAVQKGVFGGQRAAGEVDRGRADGPRGRSEYVLVVGHRSCSAQSQRKKYRKEPHVDLQYLRGAARVAVRGTLCGDLRELH